MEIFCTSNRKFSNSWVVNEWWYVSYIARMWVFHLHFISTRNNLFYFIKWIVLWVFPLCYRFVISFIFFLYSLCPGNQTLIKIILSYGQFQQLSKMLLGILRQKNKRIRWNSTKFLEITWIASGISHIYTCGLCFFFDILYFAAERK